MVSWKIITKTIADSFDCQTNTIYNLIYQPKFAYIVFSNIFLSPFRTYSLSAIASRPYGWSDRAVVLKHIYNILSLKRMKKEASFNESLFISWFTVCLGCGCCRCCYQAKERSHNSLPTNVIYVIHFDIQCDCNNNNNKNNIRTKAAAAKLQRHQRQHLRIVKYMRSAKTTTTTTIATAKHSIQQLNEIYLHLLGLQQTFEQPQRDAHLIR